MPFAALLIPIVVAQGPKLVIPKATWEPIFFEVIDERAAMSKLPSLRTLLLPKGDIEVRVWNGFGLSYLEGVVLRRQNQTWSAAWLPPTPPEKKETAAPQSIALSQEKLATLWRAVQTEGILTLPAPPNSRKIASLSWTECRTS